MSRGGLALLALAAGTALWPITRPLEAAADGRLVGQVEVVTRPSRRLATPGAYPSRTVGRAAPEGASELRHVVVYLDLESSGVIAPMRATIRQVNEAFVPGLVAVTVGSTVSFPNDDLIFHNVFSLSGPAAFDLGRYPRGDAREWTFDRPGLVKVFCHLHSHMTAVVRVFDHPYFAIPDRDGRFEITGVPAGDYDAVAWHERVGAVTHRVSLTRGQTRELSFSLPLPEGR